MKEIPKCKMCGADLYDKPQLFYDGRRKYCPVCAEWRKRTQDADRMKEKRKAERDARTQKIKMLEEKVAQLTNQVNALSVENGRLRNLIIELREGWYSHDE
jgi:uncharacterized Zn finger protein (UPF0148 family)